MFTTSGLSSTQRFIIFPNSKHFTPAACPSCWIQKSVLAPLLFQISDTNIYNSAGQDATEAFFSLHRYEILEKPQYQRLQIGVIDGEKSVIHGRIAGELSKVPYGEPSWLSPGYHTPYYSEVMSIQLCVRDE